jgi:oligopeptide transport system ATP-binding protein
MLLAAMPPARAHTRKDTPVLLRAQNIDVRFSLRGNLLSARREIKAVDEVSLCLNQGRTLGIVGESGSGKSTLARALLKFVPASGTVSFDGRDLTRSRRDAAVAALHAAGVSRSLRLAVAPHAYRRHCHGGIACACVGD